MADSVQQSSAVHTGEHITLIPVGLKEAALDSPTFRSSFAHFVEQLDLVEKWLENYVRSISRLSHEVGTFESLVNGFLTQSVPPAYISEAVLDHDYTLLAMKRYGEGAKEFFSATFSGLKKMEGNMMEPIKAFLHNDLRSFRETRRNVDHSQKHMDNLLSRYSAQSKTKEASSLREDAFQLHEARRLYLKASLDFSVLAPQLRISLDKMLVKVFSDQWRDLRGPQQNISGSIGKWASDIDRVRGWSREMEKGERIFRRELQNARKQIEETAETASRPSRELEDYSLETPSASKSRGPSTSNLQASADKSRPAKSQKQGWLNLRTVSGKPSRTVWLRRWFYVKNGIFGWLVQGSRSGGVEESERIGVLLCSVRPGNSDDRRYVFEVKTKDTTIVLQAETQPELNEWLAAFEIAKQKALEDPASTDPPGPGSVTQDPAFAISAPSAPEFAASAADSGMPQTSDDATTAGGVDRSSTLPVAGTDPTANRSSFDVSSHRRSTGLDKDSDTSRDPASRIIQKLDLHRKPVGSTGGSNSPGLAAGGIASLIAASHTSMPVGPGVLPTPPPPDTPTNRKSSASLHMIRDLPMSTLAPNTLANPPAPTNLSAAAVIVNGKRGLGMGRTDASGGMPSGIMANVWGSSNWGFLNRLEREEPKTPQAQPVMLSNPPSPKSRPLATAGSNASDPSPAPSPSHRKAISLGDTASVTSLTTASLEYPNYYPLQLKTQDAQFRLLFPNVRRDEKVVLVFKATWNPNEQQDFPGRIYVTAKEVYFYSNHCGMIMTTSIRLDSISEVTVANGRECDFLFLHLRTDTPSAFTRVTIKTFLEPLRLLQRRLSFLAQNSGGQGIGIEDIMKDLIKMEQDSPTSSPSADSWENVPINTPIDDSSTPRQRVSHRDHRDLRANVLVDRGLYGDVGQTDALSKSFKLPKQPVIFVPTGVDRLAVEKEFEISPKALFHVLFGDKSAVWQLLYHERQAQRIKMGPWTRPESGHFRREFEYDIEYLDILRFVRKAKILDHQVVDSAKEHLLYVVSDRKTPWHLPYRDDFVLLTKVVITHVAKSRCKLAIYTKVDWTKTPRFAKGIVSARALHDLGQDALDLSDVISDQCRRLGEKSRIKKAIAVFGEVGLQNQVSEFAGSESPLAARLRHAMKPRTLTTLVLESFVSFLESVATSLLDVMGGTVRWIWKTINANSIILAILAFSVLSNVVFSSKSAAKWWNERKAGSFMARIGISPDLTMSKAIYLRDLQEAPTMEVPNPEEPGSRCRDTFNDIMNLEDFESSFQPVVVSQSKPSQTSTARRIRSTRRRLGAQRHDLLVAMRVVNSIEREMVQAEWEDWLLEENYKCKQLGDVLSRNRTKSSTVKANVEQQSLNAEPKYTEELRTWHDQYCKSCSKEQDMLPT